MLAFEEMRQREATSDWYQIVRNRPQNPIITASRQGYSPIKDTSKGSQRLPLGEMLPQNGPKIYSSKQLNPQMCVPYGQATERENKSPLRYGNVLSPRNRSPTAKRNYDNSYGIVQDTSINGPLTVSTKYGGIFNSGAKNSVGGINPPCTDRGRKEHGMFTKLISKLNSEKKPQSSIGQGTVSSAFNKNGSIHKSPLLSSKRSEYESQAQSGHKTFESMLQNIRSGKDADSTKGGSLQLLEDPNLDNGSQIQKSITSKAYYSFRDITLCEKKVEGLKFKTTTPTKARKQAERTPNTSIASLTGGGMGTTVMPCTPTKTELKPELPTSDLSMLVTKLEESPQTRTANHEDSVRMSINRNMDSFDMNPYL